MQDIFALDEAVGQFESFGSQLDLGLPPVEDDAPKSFEDMLDVNPSNEPTESGEYFMNEGDDLQDTMTQKFVVDEFAKQLMKCDDTVSVQDRLPDIAAYIQGTNNIKGDVQSFLRNTIERATSFQQAQNVSDAQPNGVVDPEAQPVDAAPVDGMMADPMAEGIPTMEPIDPTAEPSLEPNPEPADPLSDLASEPEPESEDPLAGLDGLGDDLGLGDEEVPAEGEPAAEDEGDDLSALLGGDEGGDAEATGDEAATADEEAPVDGEPASDEGEEGLNEEAPAEDTEDKSDDKSDDDADFDFESIAKKAHGLVEGADEAPAGDDSDIADQGQQMGESQADTDLGGDEQPIEECGEQPAAAGEQPIEECGEQPVDDLAEKKAQIESIARQCRLRMTAEKAKKLVESYQENRARANTIARLESVVGNLRKNAQTESIIEKFAEASKAAASNPVVESDVTQTKSSSKFESIISKANKALAESAAANRMKAAADKVIAEFEANANLGKELDSIVESAAASVKKSKAQVESTANVKKELDSILESVAKKQQVSKMESDLAKIVADVKNS